MNFGLLWIFYSDQLLGQFQTLKGFAYVFLTGILLFFLVRFFQKSLQKQSQHYRFLFENNPVPMWYCDPQNGQIRECNLAASQKYGYSAERFREMKLSDLEKPPQTQAQNAWLSGQSKVIVVHLNSKNQILDIQLHFQNSPEGLLVSAFDLIEHKQIEAQLFSDKKNLEFFQSTVRSASVIAVLDKESKVIEANAHLIRLSGLSQNELLGRRLGGLWIKQTPEWSQVLKQLEKGRQIQAEMELVHGWVGYLLLNYQTGQEGPTYLLLGQEISQQKRAQTELWALTAKLVEQNQDLQQFTYLVSHNLRVPVANILGLLALLESPTGQEETFSEEQTELLEKLKLSAERMDQDLIALHERLHHQGRSQKERSWIDLTAIIEDVLSELNHFLPDPHWRPELDLKVTQINSIAVYLHSILLNLVSNALKYKDPQRPLTLKISVKAEQGFWVFELQDNGLGIDLKAHATEIFGLYQRFHTQIEGHGLGLYLVKTQTEMLGGQIHVESTPGQGSRFQLSFPIVATEIEPSESAIS
ncbi:MAG: PAS domain S-box protein [Candidatus Sericytochromatia bacterium]|nr:PAS domain S-box protein [Candidatus Sericytochromatia bacterium]